MVMPIDIASWSAMNGGVGHRVLSKSAYSATIKVSALQLVRFRDLAYRIFEL